MLASIHYLQTHAANDKLCIKIFYPAWLKTEIDEAKGVTTV
jgi:hypothetical protein